VAVEDDAAADAGSKGVHQKRVDGVGAARAEEAFAVGGESGVVSDVDGMAKALLKFGAEVEAVEAGEIRGMAQDAQGQLDGAGTADANAEEFAALLVDELPACGPAASRVGRPMWSSRSPAGVTAATRRLVPPRSTPMEKGGMAMAKTMIREEAESTVSEKQLAKSRSVRSGELKACQRRPGPSLKPCGV
jgi:hypothetical protein